MASEVKRSWLIPFGGNAFITEGPTAKAPEEEGVITPFGVANWVSASTNISFYFHMQYPGKLLVGLRLRVPSGSSRITFDLSHNYSSKDPENKKLLIEGRELVITGSEFQLVNCGIFSIPIAGYVRLDLKGLERTGPTFGLISDAVFIPEGNSLLEPTQLRYVEDPGDFYFGRRGPSVHLQYALPDSPDSPETEYFYNEIYVPQGQDVIGAYYCAMGFTGGYFGIQVNSAEERRVLFSIWSDYDTDDPTEIPEDYKVKLLRSGEDVYVGEFGNEGSGAQSYWRHNWIPETTYKFIVQARPTDDSSESTMYTAWFNSTEEPSEPSWKLIASFEKPKVSTYFKRPYSFSENFEPDQGFLERHCLFGNQWAYGSDGTWKEIRTATFTADSAANAQIRMDVAGGVGIDGDKRRFFLRNCGFFSDRVEPRTEFTRESSGELPPVDLSILP